MLVSPGISAFFRLDMDYEGLGSSAPHGFVKYKNGLVGVFKGGVYYIGGDEQYLSPQIESTTNYPIGVTTLAEAYSVVDYLRNELLISFPTDSKIYAYDLVRRQWSVHSTGVGIRAMTTGINNEIYGASATEIYRLNNGTTDDGTAINPQWKSKIYSMGLSEAVLDEVIIAYKSDTVVQFDVYLNRGSAATWSTAGDNNLPIATSATTRKIKVPPNFRGKEFEFGISIPTASRATNTYVEVYSIEVKGIAEERI